MRVGSEGSWSAKILGRSPVAGVEPPGGDFDTVRDFD
jgi:hypothetical protein